MNERHRLFDMWKEIGTIPLIDSRILRGIIGIIQNDIEVTPEMLKDWEYNVDDFIQAVDEQVIDSNNKIREATVATRKYLEEKCNGQ